MYLKSTIALSRETRRPQKGHGDRVLGHGDRKEVVTPEESQLWMVRNIFYNHSCSGIRNVL